MKSIALAIMFVGLEAAWCYLRVNDACYPYSAAKFVGTLHALILILFLFSLILT